MLKTWLRRGKHKGPVNPRLIKRAQETTPQRDSVILIKARLGYLRVYKSMMARRGRAQCRLGIIIPPHCEKDATPGWWAKDLGKRS